jgi:hypothetical protein
MRCPQCGEPFALAVTVEGECDELDAGCPRCGYLPGMEVKLEVARCQAVVAADDAVQRALETEP